MVYFQIIRLEQISSIVIFPFLTNTFYEIFIDFTLSIVCCSRVQYVGFVSGKKSGSVQSSILILMKVSLLVKMLFGSDRHIYTTGCHDIIHSSDLLSEVSSMHAGRGPIFLTKCKCYIT
jgi:hypothetical protein